MHFPSGISISCLPPHFGQVRTPVLFPAPAKGRSLHFLQYALARYPNSYFARNPALSKRRFFQDRLRVALDFFLDDLEHFLRRPALVLHPRTDDAAGVGHEVRDDKHAFLVQLFLDRWSGWNVRALNN